MGNRCCNKVPQEPTSRKGDGRKSEFYHIIFYIFNILSKILCCVFQLVSGNGDNGLAAIQRNDIQQYPGGGSSRLPSQDIIRHPPHSPMRPTNSTSPNGMQQ